MKTFLLYQKRGPPAARQSQPTNTREARERSERASPVKSVSRVVERAGPFPKGQNGKGTLKKHKH